MSGEKNNSNEEHSELFERNKNLAKGYGKLMNDFINDIPRAIMTFNADMGEKGLKAMTLVKSFIDGYKDAKKEEKPNEVTQKLPTNYEAGKNILIVSDLEELHINKEDIIGAGKPVSFRNIKRLVLEEVDLDTLNNIDSITNVEELVIPPNINKVLLLQKCKLVKKITVLK